MLLPLRSLQERYEYTLCVLKGTCCCRGSSTSAPRIVLLACVAASQGRNLLCARALCTVYACCVLCTVYPMHVPRTELLAAVKGRNLCMCTVCLYPSPQPPSPSLSYLHRPEHGVIENALRVGPVSYCQNLVSLSAHTLVLSASCYTSRAYVDISTRHAMCVRHSGCGCQRPVS